MPWLISISSSSPRVHGANAFPIWLQATRLAPVGVMPSSPIDAEPMPSPTVLTARMVAISMAFAAEPARGADIESTVVFASIAGMVEDDLRVLSVLTTWLGCITRM